MVEGSHIEAGGDTKIAADHNITLKSAKDTKDETTSNKSLGFTVGVNAAVGTGSTGVNVTGSVDYAKGGSDEHTVTNSNTTVKSGGTTTLRSGDTTTISGARVEGNRVEVDAKELKIESPQDTSSYKGDQKNLSVNVSVSVTGGGGSVGGSLNKSNVSSDFKSVGEQSGILAGDGGYKINVKDNTDLKGGVINSTNPDVSSINTGTLTVSDIQNKAEYHAGGSGINIGAGAFQGVGIKPTGSLGIGGDSGGDSGVTRGGINIPYNMGSIRNPFDAAKVRKEIETQVAVTQEFSKNAQEVYETIAIAIEMNKLKAAFAIVRPANYWEQRALDKLDALIATAEANGDKKLAQGLRNAKSELSKMIEKLGNNQSSLGINVAVYAILATDSGELFGTSKSITLRDNNGKELVVGKGQYKCNIFVAAAYIDGGNLDFINNGQKGSGFPLTNGVAPAANYLGDSKDRQRLTNLGIVSGPMKPGDIIAWRAAGGTDSGHSSIYIGGGIVIYSGGPNGGTPTPNTLVNTDNSLRSLWNYIPGGTMHTPYVVRRYTVKR